MPNRLHRRFSLLLVLSLALPACGGDAKQTDEAFPANCNLPSPPADLDTSRVPDLFVIDGAVVRNVAEEKDLLIVALNVPSGIEETYESYKAAFDDEAYDRIGEDFEGFEGELYLREKESGNLVAIQVRRPNCNEASSVTVNLNRVNKSKV